MVNSLLPGPSTCPARPSAASVAARCAPFSQNRLTPASCDSGSWSGTMAAGAREQAASCDAFVLSRRPPAPDAPPIRTSPAGLIAKTLRRTIIEPRPGDLLPGRGLSLRIPTGSVKDTPSGQRYGRGRHDRRRPVRGTSACAWNIAVRTRGVFTHRDDFQKPACAERGLVRTGTAPIISESAVAWTFLVITPATVGREESHGRAPRSARPVAAGYRNTPAAVPAQ